ncbi:hypothetical protein [Blastomonas sp. SL216]|uniref:hypothetical protein n=1 Tax=Blastomonas sp. SL216 TaxID=2995169 RepID=UPI00237713CE|nr:hypothetical protein OU999_17200 [Blastomonas sp. SL216]
MLRDDDSELATINEAIRLRGLFIHRYSGIEFSVSELIVRAREHPTYRALGDLPKPWARKVKRLKTLFKMDGPIKAYAADMRSTFEGFRSFETNRHFLVHAMMTIPRDAVDRTMLGFSMYDHRPIRDDGESISVVHAGRLEMNLNALDQFVASLQPISTNFTALVARICREIPLPVLYLRESVENQTEENP